MSERQYDGTPIDLTWNNGPWANDGETVDATDTEDGNMKTIEWPDNATDFKKLNDDQRAVIRAAARNPDLDDYYKIDEMLNLDKSDGYAAWVLRDHWPERHTLKREQNGPALTDRQVDKVRIALKNGETVNWLSDHFDVSNQTVRRAARGVKAYNDVECKTPPLENEYGGWSSKHSTGTQQSKKNEVSKPHPTATVDAWRKRALNGDTATDIANDYDNIWPAGVAMALRGDADIDGEPTQPELEWCNNDRGWEAKESDGDVDIEPTEPQDTVDGKDSQDMADTQEQATEDTTTTTDTEPPTYYPPERDSNRRLAYGVALVALVSYALGKLRGGD